MRRVVDASVIVALWIDPTDSGSISDRVRGYELHAPDHLLVEATNVVRRRVHAGLLDAKTADAAFAGVLATPARLWPFAAVAARAWELGKNVSSYDGAYIALAERLGAPLITRDARLTHAPGPRCEVIVV